MSKIIKFGEDVEGYNIPVLNEREIRASAGLLFVAVFVSLMQVMYKEDFLLLKYFIVLFLADFLIRVFINPKYSPTLIMGRLIVRNQTPEYVGAKQKKFAWVIGLVLALIMFVLKILVNSFSPITGIICMICLVFLFFESAFGICLGCKFYPMFFKDKVQYCPGEVCEVKSRHDIQKTGVAQLLMVAGLVVFMTLTALFFNDYLSKKPYDLFGITKTEQSK